MEEEDQLRFGFDLLDPTKIVPEELVPITPLGKMQLNRNPRNYFAETEQVMVCCLHPYGLAGMPWSATNNEFSSNRVTSSVVSTSPMTHCFRAVCSPIWTLS